MNQFYMETLDTGRSQEDVVLWVTGAVVKAGLKVIQKKRMKDGTVRLTIEKPEARER